MMDDKRPITKRTLLTDVVHNLVNIEQMFVEAIYWKLCRPEEEPINPDPDGYLAEEWAKLADFLIKEIERARQLMTKHGDKHGWPEVVS